MEIWYDGADCAQIAALAAQCWIKGITTNPKILSTTPISAEKQIADLLECQPGPVAVQIVAVNETDMIAQAKRLHALSSRIVVKVPVTTAGLKAIPVLTHLSIPIIATAVFSAEQFLLTATMGVQYVAPYISHMQNNGIDALTEIANMQAMIQHYHFSTKVMVASIKSVTDVMSYAKLGIGAATLSPALLSEWLTSHPLTQAFTDAFADCWAPFAKAHHGELF